MAAGFLPKDKPWISVLSLLLVLILSGCVTPTGPTEVRRFHSIDNPASLASTRIAIIPANDVAEQTLRFRVYAQAVENALRAQGFVIVDAADSPDQLARVSYNSEQRTVGSGRGPVSVGVGGGTGGFRGGLGGGIGFNLGGGSSERIFTEMRVSIEQQSDGQRLWEGEALSETKSGSPEAEPRLVAAKLADAMFLDFPGESGESYEVE